MIPLLTVVLVEDAAAFTAPPSSAVQTFSRATLTLTSGAPSRASSASSSLASSRRSRIIDHETSDGIPVRAASDSPLFASPKGSSSEKSRNRKASLAAAGLLVQTVRHAFGAGTSTCTAPAYAAHISPIYAATSSATATAANANTNAGLSTVAGVATILAARLQTTLTNFITTIRHSPRAATKPILTTALALYILHAVRDSILTHRRQKADATSEWGRYADDPAARGRALMVLCARIVPYVLAAQVLKLLPGGKSKKDGDDAMQRRRGGRR